MITDLDWARLIHQLNTGECVPFLGAGACAGTLPNARDMSGYFAQEYSYPFTDDGDLAWVMQYVTAQVGDGIYLKERVCRLILEAGYPQFSAAGEPHALLAEFPLPLYLTTNYDDFMEVALKRARREPETLISRWNDDLCIESNQPSGNSFTSAKPLVFHMHGSTLIPKSMVLTEDDYLEFLVNIATASRVRAYAESTSQDQAQARVRTGFYQDILPPAVLSAITDQPLLFIGYSLRDWTFRILFHGLWRNMPTVNRRRSISVQLLPPVNIAVTEAEKRARDFMEHYFEGWRISIFWGTAQEFCVELQERSQR